MSNVRTRKRIVKAKPSRNRKHHDLKDDVEWDPAWEQPLKGLSRCAPEKVAKVKATKAPNGRPVPATGAPEPDFSDCGLLLRQLFRKRHIVGERRGAHATPLFPELIALTGNVDQAVILSELMILERRGDMQFYPRDSDGEKIEGSEPGWLMDVHEHGEAMHGIPYRQYKAHIARLHKANLIKRRDPVLWDRNSATLRKRNRGKWLLNVRWNRKLEKIADKYIEDTKEYQDELGNDVIHKSLHGDTWMMPWALRAMLAVPAPGRKYNSEDGWGWLLMIVLLQSHTRNRKTGKVNPKLMDYRGRKWSFGKREAWAKLLGCTEDQFRKVCDRLSHLVVRRQRGSRKAKVTVLRPNLPALMRLWNQYGKKYGYAVIRHNRLGGAFVFPPRNAKK